MQRGNCSVVNYNHVKHYCKLTYEDCVKIVEDSEFTVIAFSCLHWVPAAEVVDDLRIQCEAPDNPFASRLAIQADILMGSYFNSLRRTYIWKNDTTGYFCAANGEILLILPWCSASWVPFVTGDPIPVGAAVDGYLSYPSVETYVITGPKHEMYKRCGYYNPDTKLGYAPFTQEKVITEMIILVIN